MIIANKSKKIIDFGVWNGGSAILSAKSLQHLSGESGNNLEEYDFDFTKSGLSAAQEKLQSGEKVTIKPKNDNRQLGKIYLYDLTWGDSADKRSNTQSGHFINVIANLRKEQCFSGITYIFEKYDYFEWIKNSNNKDFDFMHVDISFDESIGGDKFTDSMVVMNSKMKKKSIVCFMHSNKVDLYRQSVSSRDFENIEKDIVYNDILNKFTVFSDTFPGVVAFSHSDIAYEELEHTRNDSAYTFNFSKGDKK